MASILEFIWTNLAQILMFIGLLESATKYTNVEFSNSDGKTLYGYLSTPPNYDPSLNQSYPVAIVLHAWNGMSEEPTYFADLIAANGDYVAFAPDLFRGVSASETNIPWNIFTVITTPQSRMNYDLDATMEYLKTLENVDASTIVSGPGFCFGGSQALELSKRMSTAATISLYGSSISDFQDPNDDETWGMLGSSPILGIYGADDMAPSVEQANGFEQALIARNVTYNITIYDGVGHAFVNPDAHKEGNQQATDAWDQVISYMTSLKAGTLSLALTGPSRRIKNLPMKKRSSYAWIMDHFTDVMYHKGHANHFQG